MEQPPKYNEDNIKDLIEDVKENAKNFDFKIGDLVCYDSDEDYLVYAVTKIEDGMATLVIPAEKSSTRQEIIRIVPIGELFDPKTARRDAVVKHFEDKASRN